MTKEEQNIAFIIDGCKDGNRKAQEQLYRSYYRVIMHLCLRYTKNETEALDALNTGFYKVFKNIQMYDATKASLYTWIRVIIINSCLDITNAKFSHAETGELAEAESVHLPAEAISKLSASEILQLVRQLPAATQVVFNLYAIEGYSHKEIAVLTDSSEGTSKWHLNQARKKLQKMINEHNR